MPARDPELAAALKKPFAEQVAFFRAKLGNLVPTARWDDLWQAEHDRAFMVAGAAKADLLADLAAAVDKAIAEGETLQGFRKRFAEIVDRHGWHGWTGEATAQGRAWRTRVIYETNLITSYAAGRHAQLQAGGYDYWIYRHSDFVSRPRPHHVALDGITRRADDPFWQTHYPPNGWNCFPGHTLVRADAALGQRFFYRGQMVDFWTAGKRLTVTANHPVLTRRGWVSACEIKAGDEVIQAGVDGNAVLVGIVHNPQPPARADQLFEALAAQGLRIVPMAAHDFYGDAASGEGEVHIAGADSVLVDVIHSAAGHGGGKFSLDGALAGGIESSDVADSAAQQALVAGDAVFSQDAAYRRLGQAESPGDGRLAEVTGAVHGEDFALDSFISGIGRRPRGRHEAMLPASDGPFLDPSGFHSVAAVSDRDVVQSQDSVECATGVSKLFGELIEANAGLVSADKVIGVRQFDWAGHVYDFSTETGLIVAGGLIVSNCRCRVVGARGPASIRRAGGDPDKPLPEWVDRIDPKTQAPVGIDKGFAYAPGASVVDEVRSLAPKLDRLPRQPSIALIQNWLLSDVFERWFADPKSSFPLVRLPDADAEALGAVRGVRVAHLSAETAIKQRTAHPELAAAEYAQAQAVIDHATGMAQDGNNMIYVREMDAADTGGYVLVVKATQTGEGLWVTSYRRLSRKDAVRDSEVRRLLRKDGR